VYPRAGILPRALFCKLCWLRTVGHILTLCSAKRQPGQTTTSTKTGQPLCQVEEGPQLQAESNQGKALVQP